METDIGAPHSQPESSFLRLGKESGHQTGVCNIQLTDLCEHLRHKNRSSNIGRKIKEGHNHSQQSLQPTWLPGHLGAQPPVGELLQGAPARCYSD